MSFILISFTFSMFTRLSAIFLHVCLVFRMNTIALFHPNGTIIIWISATFRCHSSENFLQPAKEYEILENMSNHLINDLITLYWHYQPFCICSCRNHTIDWFFVCPNYSFCQIFHYLSFCVSDHIQALFLFLAWLLWYHIPKYIFFRNFNVFTSWAKLRS